MLEASLWVSSILGLYRGQGCPRKAIGCNPIVNVPHPRGRPKNLKRKGMQKHSPIGKCLCNSEWMVLEKSRTTSPKGESSLQAKVSPERHLMLLPTELSKPRGVMTRVRSALLMGKRLSLVYNCSNEVALNHIAAQIYARRSW